MRSLPTFLPLLVALVATLSLGCNMTRLAANSTVDVFAKAAPTFEKESDIELAKASGLGNIKMVEGLIEVVPDNVVLLELTSKSFGAYAFGFLEPQLDSMDSLSDEYEALALRAVNFYNRGKDYASRALELEYPGFRAAMDGPADQYEAFIQQVEPDWVSILFWVGYNWGAGINLQLEDPGAGGTFSGTQGSLQRIGAVRARINQPQQPEESGRPGTQTGPRNGRPEGSGLGRIGQVHQHPHQGHTIPQGMVQTRQQSASAFKFKQMELPQGPAAIQWLRYQFVNSGTQLKAGIQLF